LLVLIEKRLRCIDIVGVGYRGLPLPHLGIVLRLQTRLDLLGCRRLLFIGFGIYLRGKLGVSAPANFPAGELGIALVLNRNDL
jgi:hypothetical protein